MPGRDEDAATHVPPVILKFDETITLVGSNAAGPELSTFAYSSVLSNPSSTVPKSSAASESCGVAVTDTMRRVPPFGELAHAVERLARHRLEHDDLRRSSTATGSTVGTGHVGGVGTVEHPPELAELELGDEQVAVVGPAAAGSPTRQEIRRVRDERDLAAVGVHAGAHDDALPARGTPMS